MKIEVKREAGFWSVYVNGLRVVDRESYSIASRIADELESPGCHFPSEASEVAASIRAWEGLR